MTTQHKFGGKWTEEKLNRLNKYLSAYMTIFTKNERALKLNTIYVDAFAGTGYRNPEKTEKITIPLFDDKDAIELQKGSAHIALDIQPPFNEYIFVEQSPEYAKELEKLCLNQQCPEKITIIQQEANSFLKSWCRNKDWRFNRAVVFLDPYGMEVEWETIEIIAQTKAIDLWILFPLGQAVNRLLTKNSPPRGIWADRLTKFFGTTDWKNAFYRKKEQMELFDRSEGALTKEANFDSISQYFINRLKTVFPKVAENPLQLHNSKNVPIFLLCFAASNPKGASTAVKIAQDILGK